MAFKNDLSLIDASIELLQHLPSEVLKTVRKYRRFGSETDVLLIRNLIPKDLEIGPTPTRFVRDDEHDEVKFAAAIVFAITGLLGVNRPGFSGGSLSPMENGAMAQKRYPDELRERAVRMVFELRQADPNDRTVTSRVARQLGIGADSLRAWVRQESIDSGLRPGVTSNDAARIKDLEKEVKELRRTNEILKAASAFFAQEADPYRRK